MNREEASSIVREFVTKESLINHMLAVEAAVRFYAKLFNEDQELWGICGLLHDFDYEIHPDLDRHPNNGAIILREKNVPEEIIQAILSHGDHSGVPKDNLLRKTLFACDEITGLITACVLVRPSKSLLDMEISSVKKKWKDKAFAAGVNRDEIAKGAQKLGIDLWDHVNNVLQAMRSIASEISLDGSLSNTGN
ncbi:MAG: HDIG domain-containing protein [Pelolinea sp.]|nr:HDIG domain-containing protein [Pelolinea sp.]